MNSFLPKLCNHSFGFYYYDKFVCSFLGRIRGHQKVLSKIVWPLVLYSAHCQIGAFLQIIVRRLPYFLEWFPPLNSSRLWIISSSVIQFTNYVALSKVLLPLKIMTVWNEDRINVFLGWTEFSFWIDNCCTYLLRKYAKLGCKFQSNNVWNFVNIHLCVVTEIAGRTSTLLVTCFYF